MKQYSFCENAHAGPFSKWHIRGLTEKGRKLGGGADTKSLCDRPVHWDLAIEITDHHLTVSTCEKCKKGYLEILLNAYRDAKRMRGEG